MPGGHSPQRKWHLKWVKEEASVHGAVERRLPGWRVLPKQRCGSWTAWGHSGAGDSFKQCAHGRQEESVRDEAVVGGALASAHTSACPFPGAHWLLAGFPAA